MTSSGIRTALGSLGAMIAAALVLVPDGWPGWYTYALGIVNAGIVQYLGKTHPGKPQP